MKRALLRLVAACALLGLAGWGLLGLFWHLYKDTNDYQVGMIVTRVLADYVVESGKLPESWEPVHQYDQAHGKHILSNADETHKHLKLQWGLPVEEFGDEQPLIWRWWKGEWKADENLNDMLRYGVRERRAESEK